MHCDRPGGRRRSCGVSQTLHAGVRRPRGWLQAATHYIIAMASNPFGSGSFWIAGKFPFSILPRKDVDISDVQQELHRQKT